MHNAAIRGGGAVFAINGCCHFIHLFQLWVWIAAVVTGNCHCTITTTSTTDSQVVLFTTLYPGSPPYRMTYSYLPKQCRLLECWKCKQDKSLFNVNCRMVCVHQSQDNELCFSCAEEQTFCCAGDCCSERHIVNVDVPEGNRMLSVRRVRILRDSSASYGCSSQRN